ncbi:hypothetical protein V6Z12_A04G118700 [Gossypium hirsutum]
MIFYHLKEYLHSCHKVHHCRPLDMSQAFRNFRVKG